MRSKKYFVGVLATAAVVGITLSACFTANLSGSGRSLSPIASSASGPVGPTSRAPKLELSLRSVDSLGTGIGSVNGTLTDNGRNEAFPNGVKISFKGGTVFGIGNDCLVAGPSRATHVRASASSVRTVRGVDPSCPPGSRMWFGLITYRSADTKNYPNVANPECAFWYYTYVHGGIGGPPAGRPSKEQLASFQKSSSYSPMTGFGVLAILDSNQDGRYGNGDAFAFSAGCGPYTALGGDSVPTPVAPGNIGMPYNGYNYGTCRAGAFDAPGGVVPNWLGLDPEIIFLGGLGSGSPCVAPLISGNLKITVATDWTSGPPGPGPN